MVKKNVKKRRPVEKSGIRRPQKPGAKRRSTRMLPVAKRGGFLPLLLPALSAIGALSGGAAGIYKTINDARVARKQLEEVQRHNRAMEGRGLYLKPYKAGRGVRTKPTSQRQRRIIKGGKKKV